MIIGTAGHIDHGKTTLVEALTGFRMDRLPAERRRGMTLDLGFAPYRLADGTTAGVIDVPGHEDLIRTMAAGASGMDLALLVVAADEGIMPQTEEHLLVLEHLGVPLVIPVLTKCDLVTAEWLALVLEDVAARFARSRARFAVPVPVSARSGEGLDRLHAGISALAGQGRERGRDDLFRLPVDRVFTVAGAGTVVTGTAWTGSIGVGAEVRILPGTGRAKIRSIEAHGSQVEHSSPGARTALGLAGLPRSAVVRGSTIVAADADWVVTDRLDVYVEFEPRTQGCSRRVRFLLHTGTAETPAWLSPRSAIAAGAGGIARLALERPMACRGGDRFMLRSASPARPVGGGVVLDPLPPPRSPWPDELASLDAATRLRALVGRRRRGIGLGELPIISGLTPRSAESIARSDPAILRIGDRIVARESVTLAADRMRSSLDGFHRERPAEAGMPIATLRRAAAAPPWVAEAALRGAEADGTVAIAGALARRAGFRPRVAGGDAVLRDAVRRIEEAGLTPPSVDELAAAAGRPDMPAILRVAADEGALVAVERDRYFARKALETFARELRAAGEQGCIEIGPLKERLGLSRKFIIPLLEWADREGLTVRIGDTRRLRT